MQKPKQFHTQQDKQPRTTTNNNRPSQKTETNQPHTMNQTTSSSSRAVTSFRSQDIRSIDELKPLIEFEHSIYPSSDSSVIEAALSKWYLSHTDRNNGNKNKRTIPSHLQLTHRLARMLYANDDNDDEESGGENKGENRDRLLGFYMVLPLHESAYEQLLRGNLTELDLDERHLVTDASQCSRIGLHVYHIEKFGKDHLGASFSRIMLREVGAVLREFSHIEIVGLSAYCVTTAGINLFLNGLNCYEVVNSDPNSTQEHIFIDPRSSEVKVVSFSQTQSASIYHKYAHLRYMHRCKMLVTRPNQFSPVWPYLINVHHRSQL